MGMSCQGASATAADPARDAQLLRNLRTELSREPSSDTARIDMLVQEGVAILTGTVPSAAAKSRLRTAARRVLGVSDVYDDLRISEGAHAFDSTLADRVRSMLELDASVSPDRLTVVACNGRVTLSGHVEWLCQATAAVAAAHRVRGVVNVTNAIRIDGMPSIATIRGRMVAAFRQDAEADAAAIAVAVSGGTVRLSGHARSAHERDLAGATVRDLPGVELVENDIAVSV